MLQNLAHLHDAKLLRIAIAWPERTVVFTFRIVSKTPTHVVVTGRELAFVDAPRQQPWGPGAFVLSAAIEDVGDASRLTVEMQSGDVIRSSAKTWSVTKVAASP